jgi:hypothetical protein
MRIVLQNFETGLYLGGDGNWTRHAESALGFLDAVGATAHRLCHCLVSTYVVVRTEGATAVEPLTIVEASAQLNPGDALFIRGQGEGLNWEKGQRLSRLDASTWIWSTRHAQGKVIFKLLVNDQVWAQGEDLTVRAGRKIVTTPAFN